MKLRVGCMVKVTDERKQYAKYVGFIKDNLPERLNDFKVDKLIDYDTEYKIIFIGKHPEYYEYISIIEDLNTKQIFVVSCHGLKVVKRDCMKLEGGMVISCDTKVKALAFLKECGKQGIISLGEYPIELDFWNIYKEETCYRIFDNNIYYYNKEYYLNEGFNIINFDDLFKEAIMKIKVGDRVIHKKFGKGIVKSIIGEGIFGVRFDEFNALLYSLGSNCEMYHGFYCNESELKIDNTFDSSKECKTYEMPSYVDDKNVNKIIINEPCVIVFMDGYKGVAKCCPEDIFDEEIGYNIAHQRALIQSLKEEIGDAKCFLNELIK